jgi:hypothetical protein
MSTYVLLNETVYANRVLHAGSLIDSTQDDTTAIAAAGGQLYPTGDTTIDAAATAARTAVTRGQDPDRQAAAILSSAAVSHDVQLDALDARVDLLEAAGGAGRFFATVATTGALAAYTRVSYVITADANGALNPVDGQTLVAGTSKLWLKNPAVAADLALYDVTSIGGAGAKFVLTMNAEWIAAVGPGSQVFVNTGTANKDKSWTVTNDTAITAGTTAVTIIADPDLAALAATGGSALVGHDVEATVNAALDASARSATLAAVGGSALIGHDVEASVNAALDACSRAATLAAAGGAALIGSTSGTVQAVLDATNGYVKRTVVVGHADLTNAVNGSPDTINIGAVCPANSRVMAASIYGTPLTGGAVASVACDIGTAGDIDAVIDGADVLSAFVDGEASTRPLGIAPNKKVGAAQLIATFTPDGAHALVALDAGSITIDVFITAIA